MNRMWLAAVAAVGLALAADTARADFGGPVLPSQGCASGDCGPVDTKARFGLHPLLRKGIWGKKADGCSTCGDKGRAGIGMGGNGGMYGGGMGGYGAGMYGPGMYGYPGGQMPGTLVFPNHPYNRGPRDFFMWERP